MSRLENFEAHSCFRTPLFWGSVIWGPALQTGHTDTQHSSSWGEQSHYSNHPRAHTVKLGRMTMWKNPTPTPGHTAKSSLIKLIRPLRPHCSRTFDVTLYTQVCHDCQICLTFHRILKVIFIWLFQHIAHRFQSWIEFLWPLLAKLHKNVLDADTGSRDAWQRPTVGEIV